jgi:hypothetical protein
MKNLSHLIHSLEKKQLTPQINLDRPTYVQPEDSIQYRAIRIVLILGSLNNKYGLSKTVIACIDFLLRNTSFQPKFIVEYFKDKKNVLDKLKRFDSNNNQIEIDFNIVQYKSVPWDIRFNDMFLYLFVRRLISFKADKNNKNLRIMLSIEGEAYYEKIKDVFPSELNFLDLFNSRLIEDKTIKIITEVIPNSYWKQNVEIENK